MKKYQLKSWDVESQLDVLHEIFTDYSKDTSITQGLQIETPNGVFENFGGFNGQPSDLWLQKIGTQGKTKKTFWRCFIGSKRKGFSVGYYDLFPNELIKKNLPEGSKYIMNGAEITKKQN